MTADHTFLSAEDEVRYNAGQKFLKKNEQNEDVIVLPSGLQYRIIEDGDGDVHPLPGTEVEVHLEGRLLQDYLEDPHGENCFDTTRIKHGKAKTTFDHKINGGRASSRAGHIACIVMCATRM